MYTVIITIIAIISVSLFVLLFIKVGMLSKLLFKLGFIKQKSNINWSAFSWESCLKKLEYSADVVFFGDSIIRGGDFHKAFPNVTVLNLGSSGDTLSGMYKRASMVGAANPQKIFLLGGINGLSNMNQKVCEELYRELLDALNEQAPEAKIYVHSLLPISKSKERGICTNKTICEFNKKIKNIAVEKGLTFIDLYPLYEKDGSMNPEHTIDGLHLKPEAYGFWFDEIREYICIEKSN